MNTKILLAGILLVSILLVGCQSPTGNYATYGQQPQGGQYVGGGCGVAPQGDYADTPIESLDSKDSAL
jgi:hypothetical protein